MRRWTPCARLRLDDVNSNNKHRLTTAEQSSPQTFVKTMNFNISFCGKGTMCRDGINVDELLAIKKVKERQLEEAVAMATQGAMDEEETTWRKHAVEKAEAEV
mmetsp:Transcript_22236/g.48388  ORF Transcript_22236/g.48388 Transcript_22236/m.48388 type:complete len:103 (+) Transcript_22236:1732-2040(+)